MNRCERSSSPFACASPRSRITQPTPSWPQNDGELVGRRARRAAIAASRSHTSFSGSAPSRHRLRAKPHRMSGASLEKISAPAITRDQHNSRSRPSRGASDHDRPGPARRAPTDRTAPARPADRPSAERSAAPGTAAAPPARSRRRWSCRPHSPTRRELAQPLRLDRGSARSCSQIQSLNGSSFDPAAGREYFGGASAANALRIVLRCNPVRLLISRIDSPRPGASA